MSGSSAGSAPSGVRGVAAHALRKALTALPLLWGVVTLLFVLVEASPGSAVDKYITPDVDPALAGELTRQFGLDQPIGVRYLRLLWSACQLDFGLSFDLRRPVFDVIADALPYTVSLSLVTLATAYPLGIAIGTMQAVRARRIEDTAASVAGLFFYSMPGFWLAMMLQLVFSSWLDVLPTDGPYDVVLYDDLSTWGKVQDRLVHLIMPGVFMGIAHSAGIARYMRSSLLEVVRQDYVRTARAKGLPERLVIGRHALRNALLPVITLLGLSFPGVFGGAVLTETIFSWPGMGRVIVGAIFNQDTPLLIGCFVVFALLVVIGNLVADLLYALADPRIRLT